jgi:hypothetical protein
MTLEVGTIIHVIDCNRFPRVHHAQSKDGVCVGARDRHNLHSISVSSKLEVVLGHLPGSWGKQSWFLNGPNINLGPTGPFCLGEELMTDTAHFPSTISKDMYSGSQ